MKTGHAITLGVIFIIGVCFIPLTVLFVRSKKADAQRRPYPDQHTSHALNVTGNSLWDMFRRISSAGYDQGDQGQQGGAAYGIESWGDRILVSWVLVLCASLLFAFGMS